MSSEFIDRRKDSRYHKGMNVFIEKVSTANGEYIIAATDKGVCWVGLPGATDKDAEQWLQKHIKDVYIIHKGNLHTREAAKQLHLYLKGKIKHFTLSFDIQGTLFQQLVWKAIASVPYGMTRTYREIAETIKKPKAVRAVGTACGANPVAIFIPCHRVVGSAGGLGGYGGGLPLKRNLLQLERS